MANHTPADTHTQAPATQATPTVRKGGGLIPRIVQPSKPLQRAELTPLTVASLPRTLPDFYTPGSSKDVLIAEWLTEWITQGLADGSLGEHHILPKKGDIAAYLGVSAGTVQNAIRYIEDDGHVESKQRIGTVLRLLTHNPDDSRLRKQTSKRDQAVLALKHYILAQNIPVGDALPSARQLSGILGAAPNTTRLALEYLSGVGVVDSKGFRGNKANWYLAKRPTDIDASHTEPIAIESQTLIDQLERELRNVIRTEHKVGDKLPPHQELGERFKVSIKTIHDAMSRLAQQGYVQSKRGRHGTVVVQLPSQGVTPALEALFVPAGKPVPSPSPVAQPPRFAGLSSSSAQQQVSDRLRKELKQNYTTGDKLPPMATLATQWDVSTHLVRKALTDMASKGWVSLSRGRNGGTTVLKQPD
jgi:DNA-binding GntR family transcriptional regulator